MRTAAWFCQAWAPPPPCLSQACDLNEAGEGWAGTGGRGGSGRSAQVGAAGEEREKGLCVPGPGRGFASTSSHKCPIPFQAGTPCGLCGTEGMKEWSSGTRTGGHRCWLHLDQVC